MAASGGFKQECPSCGAKVPIKDPKLIGKKTDCPNCKYRFVVEAPPIEAEEDDGAAKKTKPKLDQAVTARRPVAGAGPAPKAKPGARRRRGEDDDDDEEEAAPAVQTREKAKAASSNVLILGGGLAVVALALLGVFAWMQFGKKDPPRLTARTTELPPDRKPIEKEAPREKPAIPVGFGEVTNLLPNDTEAVISWSNIAGFLNSPFGRAAFLTPGAFRKEMLPQLLGVEVNDVEKVVLAANARNGWLFAVIRTTKPIKQEALKEAMNLKPADAVDRQDYFLADSGDFLFNISQMLLGEGQAAPQPGQPRPLAVRLANPNTLVLADVAPMQAFLKAKGQPEIRKPAVKPPADKDNQPSPNFLTINPAMKVVLDRMAARPDLILAMALDMASPRLQQRVEPLCKAFEIVPDLELDALGFSFHRNPDMTSFSLGVECKKQELADNLPDRIRQRARVVPWDVVFPRIQVFFWDKDPNPVGPIGPDGKVLPQDRKLPKMVLKPDKFLKTVLLGIELEPNQRTDGWLTDALRPRMVRARGVLEMATGRPRIHVLAAALRAYVAKNASFPRGTFPQETTITRLNRPWRPDQNVSWMVELLPFLGEEYKGVRSWIDEKQPWRSPDNLRAGLILIPAFLAPGNPPSSWWVRLPSLPDNDMATTQFVGVAGVGLDAAEYMPDDKEMAPRMGVFGYYRQTPQKDIPQPDATIALIQVPALYRRPWIAGGGATVQGVPEKRSIEPFVSALHEGKPGTYAIMADGSVRFIPAAISDDLFKAMCTIKGATKAQVDAATILIPPPTKVELRPVVPAAAK